ncbi:MAG TPA: glycosyl transferase, partial [Planctomycetaceae bacterium]|nr:glycosyl transferase [Planctomycetaceae bacterium]
LHQPGSVADLTSQLRQMLDQPDSLRRLGQRGRQYVRSEASVDHEAQAIEACLNALT